MLHFFTTILLLIPTISMAIDHHSRPLRMGMNRDLSDVMSAATDKTVTLKLTNLAYKQPFGTLFVMVHNAEAELLFEFGWPSSPALAMLAETGSPMQLLQKYEGATGVFSVVEIDDFRPLCSQEFCKDNIAEIQVTTTVDFPLVTIASKAVNTNDCFVAILGLMVNEAKTVFLDGLDAGSEENNENCISIPGPACALVEGNVASGNGEGFVHVHRGFHGIGTLVDEPGYDWRNPMMKVEVM